MLLRRVAVLFLAAGVGACASSMSTPGDAAGNWAVGKWTGLVMAADPMPTSLDRKEGFLEIQKGATGAPVCRVVRDDGMELRMVTCVIDASTVTMRGPAGNTGRLQREGADRMTGTWEYDGRQRAVTVARAK